MFDLEPWQWALLLVGAFISGFSKTGVAGLGILSVALYANILPARESTGIILPMLVGADVVAMAAYRRHAVWFHLWRLFPWVAVGVVAGYLAMDWVNDVQVKRVIAIILLFMVALHVWRKRRSNLPLPHSWWFVGLTGLIAGFTTMMANAAGPVMTLYMLAVGLPKMAFLGTAAWFFLVINLFKIPFSVHLGLIHPGTLKLNALLLPAMVAGAFAGRLLIHRVKQEWFEGLALALTALAGIRLLVQ